MATLRRVAALGALVILACTGGASAFAATPQRIYRDIADGSLDGNYSKADIERAFLRAEVRTDGRTMARRPIVDNRAPQAAEQPRVEKQVETRRVPFSALDAALLIAGGVPLLLIAAGLRRRVTASPADAPAPSA
jgi:hypothetical protein